MKSKKKKKHYCISIGLLLGRIPFLKISNIFQQSSSINHWHFCLSNKYLFSSMDGGVGRIILVKRSSLHSFVIWRLGLKQLSFSLSASPQLFLSLSLITVARLGLAYITFSGMIFISPGSPPLFLLLFKSYLFFSPFFFFFLVLSIPGEREDEVLCWVPLLLFSH